MIKRHFVVGALPVVLMTLGAHVVSGQDFPNRPLRILAAPPGGSGDVGARLIAQGLTDSLEQPVIVDNRVGIVAAETVVKSPPDGYTLIFWTSSLWLESSLQKLSYDPVRDLSPITLLARAPSILVAHPSVPVKSVRELIALAKARPGELNYASGSTGGPPHLAAELFKAMAGVNIVRVPFKGGGPSLNSLIGGEVQLTFGLAAAMMPHVKSGKLRALAVTGAQPSALVPGLPTVAAAVPGYVSESTYGVFVTAKTPSAIVNRLNQDIVRFIRTAEVSERFFKAGMVTVGSSPEELAVTMKSEMASLAKLIADGRIRAE